MAKMLKRAFRPALRWRLGPNPVKNINTGLLLSTAGSWALIVLGGASAGADEATTPPTSEQQAAEQAAQPSSPLMGPSITGPFVIPQPSPKYTLGPLGDIYVDGIGAGIVQWQNNRFPGNRAWQPDLSNGQLFIQKPDGLIQFYAQPGAYSIWGIGIPQRIDRSGNLWHQFTGRSFVWMVSDGIPQNRAERQFLVPRRQASNSDRRRVPLFVSKHQP